MGGAGTGISNQPNYLTFTEPDAPAYAAFTSACIEGGNGFVSSFVFNKPLIAPIFHFNGLDASRFAITGTSTTGAAIGLTAIARNNLMDVSGTTLNNIVQEATQAGCDDNSGSDPINGACGSFRVTAASGLIRTLTLNSNATPPTGTPLGFSDGHHWTLSFPTAPLTKEFSPASIAAGETSQLTFSVANPNQSASVTLTPLDFTDNLPAGLTVASAAATNNGSCGSPSVTNGSGGALAAGATSVRATNISVAPGATCSITVNVTASASGNYTNSASNMSSSVGNLVPSGSASLTVDTLPSFGACTSTMYLAQNQPTSLYRFDTSSNPIAVQPVGPTSSFNYNAVAYNPRDNYLYAFSPSNSLLRIGGDGSVVNLGTVTNLPAPAQAFNSGEIGPDGSYYVRSQFGSLLYRVDIDTKTATSIPLTRSLSTADLAWFNGLLYTVDNQNSTLTLYAINPSSGQVTAVGPTGLASGLFGALFGASNGLYGGNNSGGFYKFNLATGAATLISGLPGSGNNDGAKCALSPMEFPADLAITKDDGNTAYTGGSDVTYQIVVSNTGPFGVQGALVNDALPAGITTANWTCGAPTNGAACTIASGTGAISNAAVNLPANSSVTFALTMTVPEDFRGDLVNTATVTSPSDSPDGNPANNTATDTNAPGDPTVSVAKELVGESITANNVAEPGEVLTYRVTVTHEGGPAFDNFEFIENIPNGATMTRVSGASGFTDPVAGASTVLLTVPQVPAGGEAVVEVDLTVAAPLPLGVTQIRNTVSGGDVPEDCATCSVTTPTPPYTPAYPPTASCSTTGAYFNTAYNGANGRKVSGFDDYWQVALTPTPINGAPPAGLTWGAATIVTSPPPAYIASPFGNAGWISHNSTAIHPTSVNYDIFYRYQFNLDPAVDPSSLDLNMTFYTDNSVYQVWVNGVAQGIRSNYGGADPYFYPGFNAAGGASGSLRGNWRTGANEIIVHIKSGPGAQAFMAQVQTPAICQPKITLRKEVVNDNGGTSTPADFTLRATGQAPLTNVAEGPMGNAAITNASIPAGTYTLGEDAVAGYVASPYSCAVDGGAAVEGNALTLANGQNAICTIVNDDQDPQLTIDKTGELNDLDGDGLLDAGETITYRFEVKNTGNVTMTGVTVDDPLLTNAGVSVTPGPQTLAPGGTATFTATYSPVQAEIDAGRVENTATGTGTPPSGPPIDSPPDTVVVPPEQTPALIIEKTGTLNDADGDGLIDLGETINFTFRVTNTGTVTMNGVTVDDPLLVDAGIPVTPGPQTLAPGGTATFTAVYTPTQAEIDAGRVENTATGTGTPPSGPPVDSPPDTVVVPPDQTPRLVIEKAGTLNDADGDGLIDLGETISYSFRVQNTGTVTMTNVTVSDPLLTNAGISVTPGPQTLAPGGIVTFTAVYTPVQADIDAGRVENTATGTGTPPSGPPVESPPDTVVVPPDATPRLTIEKTGTLNDADGDGLIDLGETISYSFLVRNTGTVTMTGVTVDDPLLTGAGISVTPGPQTLAPGGTATFTATYAPVQADIDAGRVENTATGTGTPPSGPPIESPPDTVVVPPDQASGMTIEKTGTLNDADSDGLIDLGETISYSFLVRNTGAVTLTGVTIDDPLLTNAGISLDQGPQTLAPGASFTFTATYAPVQADIDAGRVENTATGTGTPPSGPPIESPPDTVVVPPDATPRLTIEKTGTLNDADGDGLIDLGETISYSFLVRNTGTVTMSGVTVNDPLLVNAGISVTPGSQTLAPGGTATFTATYAPVQADIDAGRVENTATGTGTPPSGPPVDSPPDTVVVPPDQTPALVIEKAGTLNDADGDGLIDLGETITYSFLVRNTGTVTMTGVTVDDPLLANAGVSVTPGPQILAPRGSVTFTATYSPVQADIDAGRVENTATGTGTPPSGPPIDSPPDTVIVPPEQTPGLMIEKTGMLNDSDGDGLIDLGETISYSFLVRNTGTVTLTGVTVDDPLLVNAGISVTPGPQTLAPRGSVTFTATYAPVQADIDAGRVQNTATGTGTPPSGPPIDSPPDTVIVPPEQTPGMTIEKTGALNDADGDGLIDLGETISYSFRVQNTGTLTLTNVTVNDPLLTNAGISVTPGPQTLAPRGSVTFTATYTPVQADIDAGRVANTATGTGTPPSGPPVESPPDTVVVPPDQASRLTIEKTGALNDADGDGLIDLGETISYSFRVQNTGAVTLTNVTVDDPLLTSAGISVTPGPQTLAPGGIATFTATYTPTQADIDAGRVQNTATGTGTPPSGPPTESPPDTVVVPPDQASRMSIEKTGTLNDADSDGLIDLGETISYTFVVRNTGAVTLTGVTVDDPLLANAGISVTPGPQTLAPGGMATFTAIYVPAQADIDAGRVENTATGTGTPPSGPPVESPPDSVVVPPDQTPALTLEKTGTLNDLDGDGLLDAGETITYSFVVVNTGTVTMSNVTVDDPLLTNAGMDLDQSPQTLAPGGWFTFTATYTPSQAEIDAGSVVNTATARGTPPGGDPTTPVESPPDTVTVPPQPARLRLQKTGTFNDADGNGHASIGDTLTYTFTITNDGGQTITNVWPVDVGPTFNGRTATGTLSRFSPEPVTLVPGDQAAFTATYALSEQDIANGAGVSEGIANSATAGGRISTGEITSDTSTSVITMPAAAPSDITVTKVANLRFIRRGEQAPFTIRVTNNAGARASGLTVVDTMPSGFRFVEGSATVDGVKADPEIAGRQIRFADVSVDGNSDVEIRLRLLALSTAGPGEHVNLAHAEDPTGAPVSGRARAVVEIIVEPIFDCGDIIGKVFDDENRNGYQDRGEPGLPGVRVATVKGWLITTDKHGRFHVACADLPDARIGTNFIMKLDARTLPSGYRLTTENPRVVRLTAGKMTELNFGASIGRVVRLDLADEAFVPGDVELADRWAEGVEQLIDVLGQEQSVLRLTYFETGSDTELAEARLEHTKELIAERWRQRRRSYPLEIETRVEAGQ